jgi:4-amino-4-deoxy-L-arabinose transferase-like glycosyltransferase
VTFVASERRSELAVFALALALRLAWVGYIHSRGGALVGPDAPSYDQLALSLREGNGLQKWDYQGLFSDPNRGLIVRSFRPPLLPIVLAGIYGVAGHHYWVARALIALLGASTCVVLMRIARRLFGQPAAALAGLLAAVYPKLIYYAGEPVTETPYTFLLTCAVAVLLAAKDSKNGLWRWPLGGALMGLATLCRSALLAFIPFACLWALVVRPRKLRAALEAALIAGGFALVMAPWWGRNAAIHGRFVPATTEGGYTLWVTNNALADGGGHCFWPDDRRAFDGLTEAEIDRTFARMGWDYIRSHPGRFLELAGAKFVRFWRLWPHAEEPSVGASKAVVAGATFTPILILALYGAFAARRQWRRLLLIYLLFAYYALLHMVLMAITRYRLPLEPFLIALAAHGLVELWKRRIRPSQ